MRNIIKFVFNLLLALNKMYNYIFSVLQFFFYSVSISEGWEINGRISISNLGVIIIGKKFKANSSKNANPIGGDTILRIFVKENAFIQVGNNVGISNSTIICAKSIVIGDNVLIGGSCKIWDTNFHSLDYNERRINDLTKVTSLPIIIGNDVFIGANSIILKGVTIGDRVVIGAGSVVTSNIPEDEIWGGNPAKFIRKMS